MHKDTQTVHKGTQAVIDYINKHHGHYATYNSKDNTIKVNTGWIQPTMDSAIRYLEHQGVNLFPMEKDDKAVKLAEAAGKTEAHLIKLVDELEDKEQSDK